MKNVVNSKIQKADIFFEEGKYLHAFQIYYSLIQENPTQYEIYFKYAQCCEKLGNNKTAIELFKKLLVAEEKNREIRLHIGNYFFRNELWDETIETLSYFLPEEEPLASFFIGYSYYMRKEYELSEIAFLNFISFAKDSDFLPDSYIYLTKIYINLKKFSKAMKYAQQAEKFYGNYYELHLLFAIIYYYLGMESHSVSSIEKTMKLNKSDISIFQWAGKIYLNVGDYDRAEKYFQKYIEKSDNPDSDIYSSLGYIYLNRNKIIDAKMNFEIALGLDIKNKSAIEGLKKINKLQENKMVSDGN
ncbi:MAG: hypothetical protein STSR0008_21760 [Ignavibacterium sp.]